MAHPSPALDPATVEACAKICDMIAINAERRAAGHDNAEAKQAALDKMEAAQFCAAQIRDRSLAKEPDQSVTRPERNTP